MAGAVDAQAFLLDSVAAVAQQVVWGGVLEQGQAAEKWISQKSVSC